MEIKLENEPICPKCSKLLDGAFGPIKPQKDDLILCFYCAALLRFDENIMLRRMPKKEFNDLPSELRIECKRMQKKVLELRRTS